MERDFWASRWAEGRIGFHEGRANAHLVAHASSLGTKKRVLVPLCGKAEDLMYLSNLGHAVVGVELVEEAARAFFKEHGLVPQEAKNGAFTVLTSGPVTIVVGDFFATSRDLLGPIDALYDRAAIIALPLTMRQRYARHVQSLMPKGSTGLIINLEYDQSLMDGPPFSVTQVELAEHFAGLKLTCLASRPLTDNPRLAAAGASAREACFALTFA